MGILRRAADRPVHAYLITGPAGSGLEVAARFLAAALVHADTDEATVRRIERGGHPDVVEFEPEGSFFLARQADEVIEEVMRSPVEGNSKVVLVFDAERMNDTSANRLLKTIEEPPDRATIVLTTSLPDEVLVTIRSRCQRVDLDPLDDSTLAMVLRTSGIPEERIELVVSLAGGQLARARGLVGPIAEVRERCSRVPGRVDGTGATAMKLADEVEVALERAASLRAEQQRRDIEEHRVDLERRGYSDKESNRTLRRMTERHKREEARARRSLLLEGITAIETAYRDVLVSPLPALNSDLSSIALTPRHCAEALDACRAAREAIQVNEKGAVHLVYLLMQLPPPAELRQGAG